MALAHAAACCLGRPHLRCNYLRPRLAHRHLARLPFKISWRRAKDYWARPRQLDSLRALGRGIHTVASSQVNLALGFLAYQARNNKKAAAFQICERKGTNMGTKVWTKAPTSMPMRIL